MPSRFAFAIVVLCALPRPGIHAAETMWNEVIVRVYDAANTPADERQAALTLAASIVSAASIDVIWRTCDRPAGTPRQRADPCASALAAGELALRIVRASDGDRDRRHLPLGHATIDRRSRTGVLATVYFDRVERVARFARAERRLLLGRAIAHELAHLLMATVDHGARGLMRPLWLREEIRRSRAADWTLDPRDIAVIRAAMRERSAYGSISRCSAECRVQNEDDVRVPGVSASAF